MHNLRAILLVIAAMAGFALEDTAIKVLSETLPVGEILVILAVACAALFGLWAVIKGDRIFARHNWRPKPLLRAATEGFAAVSFATALAMVDISVVGAVFQSMPLVVTFAAALFLGETVGWRRWSAIAIGFVGVLMIIRPGLSGFDPNVLWVLVAVVMVATRDLMTRVMDAKVPSSVVSFQAFLAVIPAGLLKFWFAGESLQLPGTTEASLLVAATGCAIFGYSCIVAGMRLGDASAVTPFRYTRLVFSMAAGIVVFGERPDLMTFLGSALIIASGLYTFLRERQVARRAARVLREEAQTHGF